MKFPQLTINLGADQLPFFMSSTTKKYGFSIKKTRTIADFMKDILDTLEIKENYTSCLYSEDGNSLLGDLVIGSD